MRFFIFILLAALQPNFLAARVITSKIKREKFIRENYCLVREPEFSHLFNFTGLSNSNKDYSIQHDVDAILRLQPCGMLKTNCNGQDGYSICLNKTGQEIGIGKNPPEVVREFGEIIFKYTGDKCDNQHNYTVEIRMKCDLGVTDANEGMELYAAGYNECDFKLDWRTSAACTEPKKISCTVNHNSDHYDLSELTKISGNYEVYFANYTKKVLLNICHSVIYGPNTCKSNNAACLIDLETAKSSPLGEPNENLKYNVDGTLSLKYTDGALCSSAVENASSKLEATITFICDLDAIGTLPDYVGGMELCHYRFNWTTAAACSEQALHAKSLEKANSDVCAVKNPITGQTYNFTALMNKELSVKPFGTNEFYKFTICNAITNTTCKKQTGACKRHKSTSGGIGNSNLMWKESGPYLNYTNGDVCFGKQQKYTVIEFYCGPDDYEIDVIDLCYDLIKYSTPLACKIQKTCSTYNNQVNLSPLMLQLSNYVIKSDDTEYHINLCQPLVKYDKFSVCTDEKASICKLRINNGKVISTTNLGSFDSAPNTSSDQSAVIVYHNGSACEDDKRRRIESSISFLCDINSQMTQPRFLSYHNCTYFFEWKTSLVCGKVDGYFNDNCSINNTLGDFRNLSLLSQNKGLISYVTGKDNTVYKISLCGNKKECNGGFICDDKVNYGTSVSVLYDYAESSDIIRLHFTGGSKCSDGSLAQSVLSINCRNKNILSPPVLLKESSCYLEFEWDRPQICRFLSVPENSISKDTDTKNSIAPNEAASLSGGKIMGIIVPVLIVVIGIFYLLNESRRTHLFEMISNSTSRNCDRVKYSRNLRWYYLCTLFVTTLSFKYLLYKILSSFSINIFKTATTKK
ncbi:cation-independent mannose-6-phosphate receptor isoform X3 [Nasonia vitripennis]|uniref:MRH domain-containing protein n=1 Tax=Nasonia vitripennis TaxID=7425 RepID=A0A7M7ILK5_NASVI|nr:cation-independent mannose-6-phosphate receptor isoform X3 [Nasonia vitripennis]